MPKEYGSFRRPLSTEGLVSITPDELVNGLPVLYSHQGEQRTTQWVGHVADAQAPTLGGITGGAQIEVDRVLFVQPARGSPRIEQGRRQTFSRRPEGLGKLFSLTEPEHTALMGDEGDGFRFDRGTK